MRASPEQSILSMVLASTAAPVQRDPPFSDPQCLFFDIKYVSFKELVVILASRFHGYFLDVFRFRKALPAILNICSHRTIYN